MEENMNKVEMKKECINFESVTLFAELIEKGQIRYLRSINSKTYPEYRFVKNDKTLEIISLFMVSHDLKSDRSIDDCWEEFDKLVTNAEIKPETIVTRNLNVVKQIIAEGYGYMIKRTGVDQYKKKFFVIYANERIKEIKEKGDLESKAKYEVIHNNSQKECDIQISKLIKKAMEVEK